jgi:hypothetical protein
MKGIWALFRFLLAFLLAGAVVAAAREARAGAFSVGVGTELSQVALPPASVGQSEPVFLGPGLLLDVRMRLGGAPSFGDFGVDVFGAAGLAYHWNNAEGANETLRRFQYMGGVDVRTSIFFVGAQIAQTQALIHAPDLAAVTQLSAMSLGLRAGVNWMINEDLSLMGGAIYQTGTAYAGPNGIAANQAINQLGGFLLLHIKAVSSGSNISGTRH